MKFFFERDVPKTELRTPRPTILPAKNGLSGSALYRHSRLGGDFFDFVPISATRMLFLLSDIAGKRDQALHIAAILQDALNERAPALLKDGDTNVSDAVTELALDLNRVIIQAAGGVRPAPTFIGCLDEQFGLIHYINAGHPPAFIRSEGEIIQLAPPACPSVCFPMLRTTPPFPSFSPARRSCWYQREWWRPLQGDRSLEQRACASSLKSTTSSPRNIYAVNYWIRRSSSRNSPRHLVRSSRLPGFVRGRKRMT